MRPQVRRRHAEIQRLHAQRQREKGVPRREDLGRALLEAAKRDLAAHRDDDIGKRDAALWKRLVLGAVAVLKERGFNPTRSRTRLARTLLPMPGALATTVGGDAEDPV